MKNVTQLRQETYIFNYGGPVMFHHNQKLEPLPKLNISTKT